MSQPTQDKLNTLRARFDLPPLPNLAMALMPGDAIIAAWPEQRFGQYASALYGILEEEPKATLKDLGDAIEYTVRKIGIDHVGIASDFNDGGGLQGWENVGEVRNVTAELIQRGFSKPISPSCGRQLPAGVGPGPKSRQTLGQPLTTTK